MKSTSIRTGIVTVAFAGLALIGQSADARESGAQAVSPPEHRGGLAGQAVERAIDRVQQFGSMTDRGVVWNDRIDVVIGGIGPNGEPGNTITRMGYRLP